jgi:hypothetical protein
MLTSLLFATVAFAETPECLPPVNWIDRAREDLLAGDFPAVEAALANAETSFDCAPATQEDLARFWLYQGALRGLTQDQAGARRAFAAARRMAPAGWDPSLGDALKQLYDGAGDGEPFELRLDTNEDRAWVDGTRIPDWPYTLPGGTHLVQIRDVRREAVLGHHVFDVSGPGEITVQTGLPQFPARLHEPRPNREVPWFIAAGSSLFLSGAGAGVALWQRAESGRAPTIEAVHQHEKVQIASAWTSIGLAGSTVLLGGVALVLW